LPDNEVAWRFPLGFQALLAAGTAAFVPFLVESPRWLCLKDRHSEARDVIARLLAKPVDDAEVLENLEIMTETIAREKAEGEVGWRDVFHNGSQRTAHRILLGVGVNIFQQIGGVNVVVGNAMCKRTETRLHRIDEDASCIAAAGCTSGVYSDCSRHLLTFIHFDFRPTIYQSYWNGHSASLHAWR
jgi:hypothetical protein